MKTETDSQAPEGCARRIVRHWRVTVAVDGTEVVTIESNCLSGLENVTDFRPEIIEAAENLLAFIGTGEEAGFEFDDMPNAERGGLYPDATGSDWCCKYDGCDGTERELCYKAYRCIKCHSFAGNAPHHAGGEADLRGCDGSQFSQPQQKDSK